MKRNAIPSRQGEITAQDHQHPRSWLEKKRFTSFGNMAARYLLALQYSRTVKTVDWVTHRFTLHLKCCMQPGN